MSSLTSLSFPPFLSPLSTITPNPLSLRFAFSADEETAEQLYAGLPERSSVTLEQLQTALFEARQLNIGYHERVRHALELLGLRILV
jgi:hypothetical protein